MGSCLRLTVLAARLLAARLLAARRSLPSVPYAASRCPASLCLAPLPRVPLPGIPLRCAPLYDLWPSLRWWCGPALPRVRSHSALGALSPTPRLALAPSARVRPPRHALRPLARVRPPARAQPLDTRSISLGSRSIPPRPPVPFLRPLGSRWTPRFALGPSAHTPAPRFALGPCASRCLPPTCARSVVVPGSRYSVAHRLCATR